MSEEVNVLYDKACEQIEHWDLDAAEETLTQLLDQDPTHALALNKLGVIKARREDYESAERFFNEAASIDPELASAYSNLGNIYQERGWTDRAIAAYQRAIQIDPDYHLPHHNLGVLYKKTGRMSEGIDMLKKAARLEKSKLREEVKKTPTKAKASTIVWVLIAIVLGIIMLTR